MGSLRPVLMERDWPEFGVGSEMPEWRVSAGESERRLGLVRARMVEGGFSHVVVYGDREHFANVQWLSGFDPRFEEALIVVGLRGAPLLLVGNECAGYAPASPAVGGGLFRMERYQWFSLPDQPKDESRPLGEILRDEGVEAHSVVGLAGWKEYGRASMSDVPSYVADEVRFAAGYESVANVTGWFLAMREEAAASEIVFFEWTNTLASEGMKRVISAVRPGARDFELLGEARPAGVPLACHMTLKCGGNRASLASVRGERVERGGRFSCGIAYWGANCCRCGWVVEEASELPAAARGYFEEFAGPYFAAMGEWFRALRVGARGGELDAAIRGRLDWERFHVFLNAGHLIHFDEWLSSPVYAGSERELKSGMVMQADVIPSHPDYYSTRMEDGYALAGPRLRAELEEAAPEMMERCRRRREFMRGGLGLEVGEDVLPLGNLCGMVMPYLLNRRLMIGLS